MTRQISLSLHYNGPDSLPILLVGIMSVCRGKDELYLCVGKGQHDSGVWGCGGGVLQVCWEGRSHDRFIELRIMTGVLERESRITCARGRSHVRCVGRGRSHYRCVRKGEVMTSVLGRKESSQVCWVRNYDLCVRKGGVISHVLEERGVMPGVLVMREFCQCGGGGRTSVRCAGGGGNHDTCVEGGLMMLEHL